LKATGVLFVVLDKLTANQNLSHAVVQKMSDARYGNNVSANSSCLNTSASRIHKIFRHHFISALFRGEC